MTMATNLKFRIRVERVILNRVIKDALAAGYSISVDNGGDEPELERSRDFKALVQATRLTDDEYLYLHRDDAPGKTAGWVRFVYGNGGWDVINNYTTNLEELLAGALKVAAKYEEIM